MNLTTVFLFAICLSVNAKSLSKQVSLFERNASLEKVYKETSYAFMYNERLPIPPPPAIIKIKGKVKDEKGLPLSGVSVLIVGQKQ